MKKILSLLIVCACTIPLSSWGAVTVKKAAAVATKKADAMESATSLLPTVVGLVGSVKNLNAQQQQLSADCAPTSEEVKTVNDLVKEWAKVGTTSAEDAQKSISANKCGSSNNYDDSVYRDYMDINRDKDDSCVLTFSSNADDGRIWYGFPKASVADICEIDNPKECKKVSNIYDIFSKIPFGEKDYTVTEWNKVVKLMEKSERCAPAKINAAKRELWGGFLTQTISGVGQSAGVSGTSAVLETVSSMSGSGGIQSMLPSLGQMAIQTLEK